MSRHFDRALVLFEQSRTDLAEAELRQELAGDPENPLAHALLALCLAERERFDEAQREAEVAVHGAPDMPFAHYALAEVLAGRNRPKEAREAVNEAIRLDPSEADHFALLAGIEAELGRWKDALAASERGLALDPEHVRCSNMRAMALVNLGRRDEAGLTLDSALTRDPENAVTHANKGWAMLHAGTTKPALEHFREALRIDPDSEWARRGIVEALKARNFIYRWLLAYFLWMSRLSGRARWGVILGLYFASRFLDGISERSPQLAPYLRPLLLLYVLFVVLTWIADPLFNLLLRFSRFGRLALSRDQTVASNWLLVCLGGAVAALVIALLTSSGVAIAAVFFCAMMSIPVTATFRRQPGTPRRILGGYTIALALTGVGGITTATLYSFQPYSKAAGAASVLLAAVFIVGFVVFTLFANVIASIRFSR